MIYVSLWPYAITNIEIASVEREREQGQFHNITHWWDETRQLQWKTPVRWATDSRHVTTIWSGLNRESTLSQKDFSEFIVRYKIRGQTLIYHQTRLQPFPCFPPLNPFQLASAIRRQDRWSYERMKGFLITYSAFDHNQKKYKFEALTKEGTECLLECAASHGTSPMYMRDILRYFPDLKRRLAVVEHSDVTQKRFDETRKHFDITQKRFDTREEKLVEYEDCFKEAIAMSDKNSDLHCSVTPYKHAFLLTQSPPTNVKDVMVIW
jgi:hypothetical protein